MAIHFQSSFWDSNKVYPSQEKSYKSTFNPLFEIRRNEQGWTRANRACLSILFLRFTLWTAPVSRQRMVFQSSFWDSVYSPRGVDTEGESLSILFLRFSLTARHVPLPYALFQSSFWDSRLDGLDYLVYKRRAAFNPLFEIQSPTPLCRPNRRTISFNPLFEIPRLGGREACPPPRPFNPLFEILLYFSGTYTLQTGATFNPLFEIRGVSSFPGPT